MPSASAGGAVSITATSAATVLPSLRIRIFPGEQAHDWPEGERLGDVPFHSGIVSDSGQRGNRVLPSPELDYEVNGLVYRVLTQMRIAGKRE